MKQLIGFIKHSVFLSIVFLLISIFSLCISLLYLQKRVGQIQTSAEAVSTIPTPHPQAYVKPIATSSAQIDTVKQNKTIIISPTSSRTPTPSPIKEQSSTSTSSSSHTSTQTISPTSFQPTSTPATTPTQTTAPSNTQAEQVLQALNDYRSQHGAPTLEWSDKLGNYAQTRADKYAANGATDNHQDFQTLISTPAGFAQMGFSGLGENSSYGYPFNAADLIEKDYAADKPHDDNQLDPTWTHVGIGINGVASDIVFGK
jgi:uncharacterized protein YkwD